LVAVRDFRRLLAVRLVGQWGDGAFQAALFGATFFNPDKATSAAEAAVAFSVLLLPYSLVGPFAGIVLDRWSRQRILLLANGCRALLVVLLAASLARTGPTSTQTLLLALVVVSANRFILSGLSAALPRVVEGGRLVTANAFTTTLGTGATALGGLTGFALRSFWGEGDAAAGQIALVAALSYLAAGALATRMARQRLGPTRAAQRDGVRHVLQGLLEGATHLRRRRPASQALIAITAQRLFSGLVFVMVLMLYTPDGYLHGGLGGFGLAVAATVTGGLAAALVTPAAVRRFGARRWIVVALLLAAATTAVCFPAYTQVGLVAGGVGLGFASQASKICVDTLLQESVEDDFRGRVFALYDMLFNVSFVAAAALAALVVPDDGHSLAVVALVAVGYAVTAVAFGLRGSPSVREAAGRSGRR
jgi:MFS family permease